MITLKAERLRVSRGGAGEMVILCGIHLEIFADDTVELHRTHIIEKLRARSLSDLIRMAIILKAHPNNSNN
jgi:hypothetical protein